MKAEASGVLRLAMWSGPRNISTALLRSWGSRTDTVVCDEPLYAFWLRATGAPHPGREEILRRHDSDWRHVVARLTGDLPPGKRIFYQKHMAHHLLPEIGRDWLDDLVHAFLIRDPAEMLASLARVTPDPRLEDTGLPQQAELFHVIRRRTGTTPPVLDARDVLEDPPGILRKLCRAVGVPFQESMLTWPPGPRETDGVWGKHWYAAVYASTGFEPRRPASGPLPERLGDLYASCLPYYHELHAERLT